MEEEWKKRLFSKPLVKIQSCPAAIAGEAGSLAVQSQSADTAPLLLTFISRKVSSHGI